MSELRQRKRPRFKMKNWITTLDGPHPHHRYCQIDNTTPLEFLVISSLLKASFCVFPKISNPALVKEETFSLKKAIRTLFPHESHSLLT